jgi:hypothetical protein
MVTKGPDVDGGEGGVVGPSSSFAQGWTDLSGTHLHDVCPANNGTGAGADFANYSFQVFCPEVTAAWSGGAADMKRNRLVIWGGGHSDYAGNEVYALDLVSAPPAMKRLTSPSAWNYTLSYEQNSDGTPTSRHTYNDLAYLAGQDALFSFSGGLPAGTGTNHTWRFDFADQTWHAADPVQGFDPTSVGDSVTGAACAYDPSTQVVFCVNGTAYTLLRYDAASNAYTKLSFSAIYPLAATAAIDPVRKLMIFMGTNGSDENLSVQAIDISGNDAMYAVQDWSAQVTGCAAMAVHWPGLVHDSAIGKLVGWPNAGGSVYVFDPDAKTCTEQTFPNGPPTPPPPVYGTFGRFAYFPALDVFAVVTSADFDAYVLRL